MLGLCRRAGRLTSGDQAVRKELARDKVKLLVLAEDASKRTNLAFNEIAQSRRIPVIICCSREVLGQILGKPPRSVVAILDEQFARGMLRASGRGEFN
ncbi:MAG: ribosomal L7Ae/L30e/S12e/Gadd45 family protein [Bacillota bacterium]